MTQEILTEHFVCQNPHPAMNLELSESPTKDLYLNNILMSELCQKELLLS